MSYAVVTGASGGIGKAMAYSLAQKGYDLFLVARSETALKEIADTLRQQSGRSCHYLATDLSHPDAPGQVAEAVTALTKDISVLINNAGYGLWGEFGELTLDDQRNMMQLNMFTLVALTHRLLPLLKQQPKSYVLNIASTAAYQAVPTMSVYAATKSFVLLFSRGLRHELHGTPVSVTVVSPGPVSTGFLHRAGMHAEWLVKRSAKYSMTPDEVARLALRAMFSEKAEVVPGFLNALSAALTRISPKRLTEKIAAGLYKE
jgi:short-subunit dehydrogenase